MPHKVFIALLLFLLAAASPAHADETEARDGEGTIFTLWPLVDYRESPREGFSNLSILGPLFKLQYRGGERDLAVRPLFYNTANRLEETSQTSYLYPIASSAKRGDGESTQVLKLFQRSVLRRGEAGEERGTMLFPFYISGVSKKYGPYTSVFPFYGDLYERFWKDEYHYFMFPLYSRTVKKGTTTRSYLYPLVSVIEGEKEHGFQLWPLYGQSAKEGVYRKRFALWPIFFSEETGLDTDNPTEKLLILPFYAATDSPKLQSRHYLWPFFGYTIDRARKSEERDYFWPFLVTVRGESRNMRRYIPFYSEDRRKEHVKRWYMWPFYSREEIDSASFRQERDRVLYFLYSDNLESWPADGKSRRRVAVWPLFTYKRDHHGIRSFGFPAPLEPIVDREEIEKSWSPLWRIYAQRWNDADESAVSFLWNLYWHEYRRGDLAFEFFPLVAYRSERLSTDFRILKGMIRYQRKGEERSISLFWLPLGLHWGKADVVEIGKDKTDKRSEK